MQVLEIAPKDIHVTIDLSATEVRALEMAIGNAKIDYDGKEHPEMVGAVKVIKDFFSLLKEVSDGLPKHPTA